jgi:ribosome-associated protein
VVRPVNYELLEHEVDFSTSRSSGPGGQNVNKVNSKVTLKFDLKRSQALTEEEKDLLLHRLSAKLTTDGVLLISSQEKRSQLDNKESAIAKFEEILRKAFAKRKKRKPTKPSKASKEKRIKSKKVNSEKKKFRQKLF